LALYRVTTVHEKSEIDTHTHTRTTMCEQCARQLPLPMEHGTKKRERKALKREEGKGEAEEK